jgi:adenosylhomocysteine nucleosidase
MTHCGVPSSGFGPTDMPEPPKKKVAIVAALEREVRPLVKDWDVSTREHDGRRFHFFEKDGVVLVCGGIGSAAARRAAEAVIALFSPDIVYSVGFAGALDPQLKVGDVMRPRRVFNASDGSSVSLNEGDGVLVSFGSVASPEQKRKLHHSFGAEAVDMEAAAVLRAADAHGIGFSAIKAISDEADFDFPDTERFVDSEGRFSEIKFAIFAAIRPWLWARVFRLARNSRRAARSLCQYLTRLCARGAASSGVEARL